VRPRPFRNTFSQPAARSCSTCAPTLWFIR
jgi:hypothetical protein